jgi:hypothetical protein
MAAGFFEAGHKYVRTDFVDEGTEFWCYAVDEAPQPGVLGRFAFGFEIIRGVNALNRWLPYIEHESNGKPKEGEWVDAGLFVIEAGG